MYIVAGQFYTLYSIEQINVIAPPSSEVLCYRVVFRNLARFNRASLHLFTSGLLDTLKRIYRIQRNIEDTSVDLGK